MKHVGILGGTFDPIHNGHLTLAQSSYEQFNLSKVVVMVSPDPPHKKDKEITPFKDRFNMAQLATINYPFIEASDYETKLPQPSYTLHTLKCLKEEYKDTFFYFIIGEDSLDAFESWYHPEEILKLAEIIVAVRHDNDNKTCKEQIEYLENKYNANIHLLNSDYIDISSTEIRELLAKGESIDKYVPKKVSEYIWKEKLYTK